MSRRVKMPLKIDVQRLSYQLVISVNLHDVSIPDWCLNLCLLKEGMVNTLVIAGNKKLEIAIDKGLNRSDRAKVAIASDKIHLAVHPDELDYWLSFFLKYYRDGVAEVDHIDVEALAMLDQPEEVYVTFKVKDAVPPMPEEEARRMLEMD